MLFHNPQIIYFALRRSLTQLLPPCSTPIDLYTLALVLPYVGTSMLGLPLEFVL